MKKLVQLSIIFIILIAGCTQQPTGKFLTNQTLEPECIPDWNCTFWSECIRTGANTGIQNRTCIDNNNCNVTADKPQESRACGLPRIALKEPSEMVLQISDLPNDKNWTIIEKNLRSREEVSQIERELGFKKGYYVHYFSQYKKNNNINFIHVYHFVSIYPLVNSAINMTYSFETAKENYKIGSFYENTNKKILSVSELSNPFIGDSSIAYNITVTDFTGFEENIYTICFTKWDVAEVITIEGNDIDYEFLKKLAEKAEERIS